MPKITTNQILGKIVQTTDRVFGHSARKYNNAANTLREASGLGIKGIPGKTINRAQRMANVERGRSFQTRLKVGLGGAAAVGGGFLGLHKYHQHKDNKILERIDKMFEKDYTQNS